MTNRNMRLETDPTIAQLRGAIRRFAIGVTAKALWQLLGHRMPDGQESFTAEVFTGIGFFSRPAADGKPEAIVLNIYDAKAPVVVATRDEKTRKAVAGNLKPGETAMFTPASIVHMKDDGTIEARSKNGVAVPLATKADLQAVVTYLKKQFDATAGHTHSAAGAGPPIEGLGVLQSGTCPAPTGTTKLKGE